MGFVSDLLMAHIENATQLPRPHSGEPQCKLAVFIDALLSRSVAPRQCYVYAIILLRRFMSRNRFYPLTINNVYRIMLTSVIISSRLLIDNPPTLEQWNELSLSHYGPDMLAVFEQEYFAEHRLGYLGFLFGILCLYAASRRSGCSESLHSR